jgi:hypothetical protein
MNAILCYPENSGKPLAFILHELRCRLPRTQPTYVCELAPILSYAFICSSRLENTQLHSMLTPKKPKNNNIIIKKKP